jgi:hypothetical protein
MSAMSALSAIGAPCAPPLPRSTPKNKDLAVSTPGLTSGFLRFPDVPNHQISKARSAQPHPHPAISIVYCKQKTLHQSTLGPPLRHAWVTLGPRLGHPRATQTQSQSAEGRNAPLPLHPMSTQFDPRSPKTTQGFGRFCQIPRANYQEPLFCQIPGANYQEPLLLAASFGFFWLVASS